MNLFLQESTSAAGAMRPVRPVRFLTVLGFAFRDAGTSATSALPPPPALDTGEQTTSGAAVATTKPAGAAISELRQVSGLTWDQLARLFGVSRRSVHFWASGSTMTPANQEKLQRVLAEIRKADRGSASANRAMLLSAGADGVLPIDLLKAGQYERASETMGPGRGRSRPSHPGVSPAERAARAPMRPENLVGALQDRIHLERKVVRPARSAKAKDRG